MPSSTTASPPIRWPGRLRTLVTTDLAVVAGEITTKADLSRANVDKIVATPFAPSAMSTRKSASRPTPGQCMIHSQSPDISMGVDVAAPATRG